MADQYIIRVTAGPGYDESQHVEVPVNQSETMKIKGAGGDIELNFRIQDYKGLPRNSPSSSPYFDHEPHAHNQDQYSISFRFTPRRPNSNSNSDDDNGISGSDLQFGNDFDHPIRDRLPPGFNTAMSIVRWWIDPGLDGDAYADRPHLYGPALSSFNAIHVGPGTYDEAKGGLWIEEGGSGDGDDNNGTEAREKAGMPPTSKARMKWALGEAAKKNWTFAYDQTYSFDFFNPYLDFSNLALRLPGFHLPIMKYWDGQGLRYVLRNKSTEQVYLVVLITIYRKEDVNDDGTLKEGADRHATAAAKDGQKPDTSAKTEKKEDKQQQHGDHHDEDAAFKEAEAKLGPKQEAPETHADDVD